VHQFALISEAERYDNNMLGMEPIDALKKIVTDRGIESVLQQPEIVENLMLDHCQSRKPEIHLLVSSLKENVPQRILGARTPTQRQSVIGQVSEQLQDNLGMQQEKALWTVNAWLTVLPAQSEVLPPPPKQAEPPPLPIRPLPLEPKKGVRPFIARALNQPGDGPLGIAIGTIVLLVFLGVIVYTFARILSGQQVSTTPATLIIGMIGMGIWSAFRARKKK
jgi:hypothetical protein